MRQDRYERGKLLRTVAELEHATHELLDIAEGMVEAYVMSADEPAGDRALYDGGLTMDEIKARMSIANAALAKAQEVRLPEGFRLAIEADETFRLMSPTGSLIWGTNELIPGTARAAWFTDDGGDSGLCPEYEGDTDVAWNGQEAVGNEVVDENGDIWDERECVRVCPWGEQEPPQ